MIPTKRLKNGFEIPVYGLGTWEMGGRGVYNPQNNDNADIEAIKTALQLGVRHIDTAESYAGGYAEILVGRAIKDYDRSSLFIASKVHADHLRQNDLINAVKGSLKRVGTSYLDLYLIHRFNKDIPLKETMRAMEFIKETGLIKNIGVSNFNKEELLEAQSYINQRIEVNQLHYNFKYREAERKGLLDYCQKNDVMFVAWRPLQKGLLVKEEGIIQEMAEKYKCTRAQIALNWLVSQEKVVTIAKTSRIQHLKENLKALNWQMDKADIEKLRLLYPDQQDISDTVPLN